MKKFTEPEILVEQIAVEDVITTSGDIEEQSAIVYGLNQLEFN